MNYKYKIVCIISYCIITIINRTNNDIRNDDYKFERP